MTDGNDPGPNPDRRTLLKGVGLGALGAAGLGAAWSVGPGLLGTRSHAAHADVMGLVETEGATHRAAGGRWAERSTWEDGSVPDDDARVHIPAGVEVTLDHRDDARLWTVRVDGTLRIGPESDVRLALDTLVVTETGRLTIGTPDEPIRPERTVEVDFVDRGEIDESWDRDRVSRGLLATEGASVSIHGAEKSSWDALSVPPVAGDREIELAGEPTGWQPGETLVVAGLHPEENRDEEVTVASVDGTVVTIEQSLEHDHVPPRADLDAYVANLDRNVRFASETRIPARRGHVMFMNSDVSVANAGFYDLGRTEKVRPFTDPANGVPPTDVPPNPQARYGCHFHRTGVDTSVPPREVRGCVVWGSPGWGFVNHDSYVEFVDNVSYEVSGAGFVAEIGTEVGSFEGNFALRGRGSGEAPDSRQFREGKEGNVDDFGHGGHGFWFQGPGVAVEDNVAGGHRHFGFVYWTRGKPDRPVPPDRIGGIIGTVPTFPIENVEGQPDLLDNAELEDGKVPPSFVRIRSFRGNTVFGSGGGLDVSRHRFGDSNDLVESPSVVEGFTAYNVGPHSTSWDDVRPPNSAGAQGGNNGITIRYSKQIQIRDVRLVAGAGDSRGIGINHNDAPVTVGIEGADVEGWKVGIRAFQRGAVPIRDATLGNDVDVQLIGGGADTRWAPQQATLENVSFGDGGRTGVFLTADLEGDLYGLFSPESVATLEGRPLYHDAQRADFEPIPASADLEHVHGDSLGDLGDVEPDVLVGKSNAELWERFGIAVDGELVPANARRDSVVEGGYVSGGSGGSRGGHDPIDHVVSAEGSLFELGRLAQGERLFVYDDPEFLAVPGIYTGLPYVRPEREDASGDRPSFYHLWLSGPASVFVAYDAEASAAWLESWTDTGTSIGTTSNPRRVYGTDVGAGLVTLGPCQNTHNMYTVFARER